MAVECKRDATARGYNNVVLNFMFPYLKLRNFWKICTLLTKIIVPLAFDIKAEHNGTEDWVP